MELMQRLLIYGINHPLCCIVTMCSLQQFAIIQLKLTNIELYDIIPRYKNNRDLC